MNLGGRFIAFVFLTGLAAGSVQKVAAETVTFEGLPDLLVPAGTPWIEDRVTAMGNPVTFLGSFPIPGTAHLDDFGTSMTSFMDFTMPRRFTPISFDVHGFGSSFVPNPDTCEPDCIAVPFDNVVVTAVRDGMTIFEHSFYAGDRGRVSTYTFPTGVNFLVNSLSIRSVSPPSPDDPRCGPPCGHFSIDNVELAPIPLPASALLLVGALAAAGGLWAGGGQASWRARPKRRRRVQGRQRLSRTRVLNAVELAFPVTPPTRPRGLRLSQP
jgi:hypothetical protein